MAFKFDGSWNKHYLKQCKLVSLSSCSYKTALLNQNSPSVRSYLLYNSVFLFKLALKQESSH